MQSVVPSVDDIIAALETAATHDASDIAEAFRAAAGGGQNATWSILIEVFSMMLHAADVADPIGPLLTTKTGRSRVPTDLSDAEVDCLRPLVQIEHAGFRARLGDAIWLRSKDANCATMAAEAYRQIGITFETDERWFDAAPHYERGLRLAKQIDRNGGELTNSLQHLHERVHSYGAGRDVLRQRVLALLYEFRDGEPAALGQAAMQTGSRLRASGDPGSAREAFDLAAKFYHRAKQPSEAQAAQIASAETFLDEADAYEQGTGSLGSHGALQKAILAFQKITTQRDRIPDLQKRLRVSGKAITQSMSQIEVPMDIAPLVERATEMISGATFEDALCKLSLITRPIDPDELRLQIERVLANSIHGLFDTTTFDDIGRTVGVSPGALGGSDEAREKQMRHQMHFHAGLNRQLVCSGYIAPALSIICEEHSFDDGDIAKFVCNNALVPESHSSYIVRGIAFGIRGDFAVALHLLVPQVESMLRLILFEEGVITTDLKRAGIETEWSLGKLMAPPGISQALGKDLVFELSDLLLGDPSGSNLRNTLAHGLLPYRAMQSVDALYLWWILLRCIVFCSPLFDAFVERHRRPGK